MQLSLLRLGSFRGFVSAELRPQPGLNLLVGHNGAGKTSVLEAVHLLAHGRSFRGRVRDGLVRQGCPALEVYAEWTQSAGQAHRAGLRHSGRDWSARLDGSDVATLAELCSALAVVSFDPGSHELIAGSAELRRRFLDWALFHVEPDFLPVWRRYARALRQRNALLKTQPGGEALAPWDQELAESGETLHRLRLVQLEQWRPHLLRALQQSVAELGEPGLEYVAGWRIAERSLAESLRAGRERDVTLGYTVSGPHRADWRIDFPGLPGREALSRGQAKLVALACVLSQAALFAGARGEWPLVCLDDLGSELDLDHQQRVLRQLGATGAQVLLTGTEVPQSVRALQLQPPLFHVEHGAIAQGQG